MRPLRLLRCAAVPVLRCCSCVLRPAPGRATWAMRIWSVAAVRDEWWAEPARAVSRAQGRGGADRVYALCDGPNTARGGRTVARRDVSNTEIAALPEVVDWPNLKRL